SAPLASPPFPTRRSSDLQGFQILEKGDTIVFTGKSDMLLRGAKPAVDKTMPAALPGPIAASAARAAAEAKPMLATTRPSPAPRRSEEHTSELQSRGHLVC